MDKVQKIREEVERLRNLHQIKYQKLDTNDNMCLVECGKRNLCNELLSFIDSLQEEPVSEDLEKAARAYSNNLDNIYGSIGEQTRNAFKAGAEWQRTNLWKPADGDDLPEIDREVIVLTQHYPLEGSEYAVYFAHRPNPDGWDGKSLSTGKVEHYTPKTYDKGGWNIPDIIYWLDVELPKETEL